MKAELLTQWMMINGTAIVFVVWTLFISIVFLRIGYKLGAARSVEEGIMALGQPVIVPGDKKNTDQPEYESPFESAFHEPAKQEVDGSEERIETV